MVKNLPQRKQRWKIIRSGGRFSEKIRGAVSILERKSKVVLAVKWHPWQRAQPCEPVSSMRTRQNLFLVGPINSARDEIRKKNRCVSSPRLFVSRVSRNKGGGGGVTDHPFHDRWKFLWSRCEPSADNHRDDDGENLISTREFRENRKFLN